MAAYTTTRAGNWSDVGAGTTPWAGSPTVYPGQAQTITGCANNGSGLIRVTLSTSVTPAWSTGDKCVISGVVGTTEANSAAQTAWTVTVIDSTHIDLQGSTFFNTYTSGGTAVRCDTITVTNAVTVDTTGGTKYVGLFTATTAIQVTSSSLTLASGASLTVRGNWFNTGSTLTANAGSTITADEPAATTYDWRVYNPSSVLNIAGTSGSPVTLQTIGTLRQCTIQCYSGTSYTVKWCNVTGFGTSTNPVFAYDGLSTLDIENCTFTNCSGVTSTSNPITSSGVFKVLNTKTTGSTGNYDLVMRTGGSAGTGTVGSPLRLVDMCSFSAPLSFTTGADGFVMTNSFITGGINVNGAGPWLKFANNVHKGTSVGNSFIVLGDITGCIAACDDPTHSDPNTWQLSNNSPATVTISGCVYQVACLDTNGAFVYGNSSSWTTANLLITLKNNILLPNVNLTRGTSGSLFNITTCPASASFNLVHNTFAVDSGVSANFNGGIYIGDLGGAPPAGVFTSIQANLAWSGAAAAGHFNALVTNSASATTDDIVVKAACGYNGGLNLDSSDTVARTSKTGYRTKGTHFFSTGAPLADTTDVDADPYFLDRTRDLSTAYVGYFGQTTTGTALGDYRATLSYLQANMPSNSSLVPGLIAWVQQGFAPTNPQYNLTPPGDTNAVTNIGAVQGYFAYVDEYILRPAQRVIRLNAPITGGWTQSPLRAALAGGVTPSVLPPRTAQLGRASPRRSGLPPHSTGVSPILAATTPAPPTATPRRSLALTPGGLKRPSPPGRLARAFAALASTSAGPHRGTQARPPRARASPFKPWLSTMPPVTTSTAVVAPPRPLIVSPGTPHPPGWNLD